MTAAPMGPSVKLTAWICSVSITSMNKQLLKVKCLKISGKACIFRWLDVSEDGNQHQDQTNLSETELENPEENDFNKLLQEF